jgi:hypothetical protein
MIWTEESLEIRIPHDTAAAFPFHLQNQPRAPALMSRPVA